MKKIPLTKGKFAIIDDKDFELISLFKWCACKERHRYSAITFVEFNGKWISMRMPRLIMSASPNKQVDHEDHDTLNNRRYNLRLCTNQQNSMNRSIFKSSSKYKGVHLYKRVNKWTAHIKIGGKKVHLGYFHEEKAAAQAYNIMARKHFGEFACYNKI